jgi:hypothetical protein
MAVLISNCKLSVALSGVAPKQLGLFFDEKSRVCENCGKDISNKQKSARFCSKACHRFVYVIENKEKLRKDARERRRKKRELNREADNKRIRDWKRKNKKTVQEYRKQYAEKKGRNYRTRKTQLNDKINQLVKTNARQAWKYWLTEKAPAWWLDAYWLATGKPWLNPALNKTQKYHIRYHYDAEFNLKERLRSAKNKAEKNARAGERVRVAIKNKSSAKSFKTAFGYTPKQLMRHLESQFTKEMNWNAFNAGKIHIDHIIPKSFFDTTDEQEFKMCWCLFNLQPLWAEDNLYKNNRVMSVLPLK